MTCPQCHYVMDASVGCAVCPLQAEINRLKSQPKSREIALPPVPPVPPVPLDAKPQGVSMLLSKMRNGKGVKVMQVFTGAAPDVSMDQSKVADIRANDDLIEVNGINVEQMELEAILQLMLRGESIKVRLQRMVDGEPQSIEQEFVRWVSPTP